MKKSDVISAVCEFISVELLPTIENPVTRWTVSGMATALPFMLEDALPDISKMNPAMVRAFVKGAFSGQPTLTIKLADFLGDKAETKYPIFALDMFSGARDLSFDIDYEAVEKYLDKVCGPSKTKNVDKKSDVQPEE